MKRIITILISFFAFTVYGQTNTFPPTGNVGIGTTSPQQKLHVEGNIYINTGSFMINQTADTNSKFYFSNLGTSTWDLGTETDNPSNNFILYNRVNNTYPISVNHANVPTFKSDKIRLEGMATGGGNVWDIKCRDFIDNDFGIYNVSQSAYRLYINNLGNVGIGTTLPDAKFAVKGAIHSEEVKVDLSIPAPDYVFEKDYQLPSLNSIKTYIGQHKHLPEVASAKEMEANGVNLGEMNMILLKKVEELTLYMIQQQEQINRQASENKVQVELLSEQIELLKNK